MKVLLDTHVWIWWLLGSEHLSAPERIDLLLSGRNANSAPAAVIVEPKQ